MKKREIYTNLVIILSIALIGMGFFIKIGSVKPASLNLLTQPTIIIDAGHGGIDGGAVGVDGIVEKNINLSISQKLRDLFVLSGFNVVMTRDADISIHDEGVTGARNQKVSDLNNRLKIIRDNPGGIFISVHQNQFTASQYHGAQIFYSTNSESSQNLAEILQRRMREELDPENNREIKPAGDDLFLLRYSPTTAILAECGFLSNPTEAHKLTDDEYQNDIAFVIYSSVLEYLYYPI